MSGRHDGYAPVLHERHVTAAHGTGWVIVDHLMGEGPVRAAAMWHIHPSWRIETLEGATVRLRHADGAAAVILAAAPLREGTDGRLDEYAPEYGRLPGAQVAVSPSPQQFRDFMLGERERWGRVIRDAKITPE